MNRCYLDDPNNGIMDIRNFNEPILRYLCAEYAFTANVLVNNPYSTIIEFGCGNVRFYELSQMNNIQYIGVDLANYIKDYPLYFSTMNNIRFYQGGILEFLGNYDLPENSIAIFPFNLLGNLSNIDEHIEQCWKNKLDIIIS